MKRGILILLCIISITSCRKDNIDVNIYNSEINIAYDKYPQTLLDVYTPTIDYNNSPVLIYIHGGGWSFGDKSEWDTSKIEYFCNKGYICVSVNYRLSPDVVHPTHIQDVANAINWVEDNISKYGGNSSDITLIGHSAGAHLVALAVTNQKYINNAGANIHNINKAYILDAGAYLIMNEQIFDDNNILNMIYGAAGNDINSDSWKDFAPYSHIDNSKYIPYLIIAHSDSKYRCNANGLFCTKLDECNIKYEEYILNGYSHGDVFFKFPFYINIFN